MEWSDVVEWYLERYPDDWEESIDDFALSSHLFCTFCGPNPERVARLLKQSPRYRQSRESPEYWGRVVLRALDHYMDTKFESDLEKTRRST